MNKLSDELSPYLRQHADNPVDWFPWGEQAFQVAQELNKPILLSVGYSACHWCHVMAHESFEDEATAALMNEFFVNVKVDREERPDVDEIYMAAVTALTGQGGWPMTVFMTPDGAPFFAGTYFPPQPMGNRPSFVDVLERINEVWQEQQKEVLAQSEQIVAALKSSFEFGLASPRTGQPDEAKRSSQAQKPSDQAGSLLATERIQSGDSETWALLDRAINSLKASYDPAWGGFGMAPKFPQTMNLEFLLRQYWRLGDTDLLQIVENSFDCMASGGIYDHLGGGFARYSVDRQWLVPHFEKMLYDNALLVKLALHLWQITGKPRYLQVLEETIAYVLRELRHPSGGFYSSQDADSEGEEGKYYVWSASEFQQVASAAQSQDDLKAAMNWYGVSEQGNFEGNNILWRPQRADLLRPSSIEAVRRALLETRNQRVPPGLDDKVLTEWNALMLASLAEAAAATGNQAWQQAAVANAEFLCANLKDSEGRWLRVWQARQNGDTRSRLSAYAVDYAALADAFICVYQATGKKRWLEEACSVADEMLDLFWDKDAGGLFTVGSDAKQLIVRAKDVMDNSQPSANSAACYALLRLHALTGIQSYEARAQEIIEISEETATRAPSAFGLLLSALDFTLAETQEIVVAGSRPDLVKTVHQRYLPNSVLSWGEPTESPLWEGRQDSEAAFVCSFGVCQAPAKTVSELEATLAKQMPALITSQR